MCVLSTNATIEFVSALILVDGVRARGLLLYDVPFYKHKCFHASPCEVKVADVTLVTV